MDHKLENNFNLKCENNEFLADSVSSKNIWNQKNTWGFASGFIVGQLSFILILIFFLKFFFFSDRSHQKTSYLKRKRAPRDILLKGKRKDHHNIKFKRIQSKIKSLLEKTHYDVENNPPESLNWFNVLVAQTISQIRTEALISDNIYHSLNDLFSQIKLPSYIGKINIIDVNIGDAFPIFSNCKIKQSIDGSGRLQAKIDVNFSDTLTLGIETEMLLNYPKSGFAELPLQFSITLVKFSGCLNVSLINSNDHDFINMYNDKKNNNNNNFLFKSSSTFYNSFESGKFKKSEDVPSQNFLHYLNPSNDSQQYNTDSKSNTYNSNYEFEFDDKHEKNNAGLFLMFFFDQDYELEFEIKSFIGEKFKLQNPSKFSNLFQKKLKNWFDERCVGPRFQLIKLPSFWPRKKNTREPFNSIPK